MTNRRTGILVLSLLIGSIAALFAYMYVNSAQDRAFRGAKLVSALVLTGDVDKGTSGDSALGKGIVKAEDLPEKYRPATALADKESIRGKVAGASLAKGQVVVDGMFVDPSVAQETAAKRVPKGQVAITVQVDPVRGVAGLITPGDQVNILTKAADGSLRVLFQNVDVLYVGQVPRPEPGSGAAAAPPPAESEERNLVTFAVPPLAAEKILFASQQEAGIHLTLVPPDNAATAVPPVNHSNLFTGGATPYEG